MQEENDADKFRSVFISSVVSGVNRQLVLKHLKTLLVILSIKATQDLSKKLTERGIAYREERIKEGERRKSERRRATCEELGAGVH